MNRWTDCIHYNPCPGDPHRANSTPIYQTATFSQSPNADDNQFDYSRSGNPTRGVLEKQLAHLDHAKHAFVFTSGMAAISAVTRLLNQGDHIIAGADLYGGTYRLLAQVLSRSGISVTWVDTSDLAYVASAIQANTRMILLESPSNPLQKISDIVGLAKLSHKHSIKLVVDSSLCSPWLQQPLSLEADVVIHSATKHLSGHSDLTAGVVTVNDDQLAQDIAFIQNAEGTALSPFTSWLLLRDLHTLGLRIERAQQGAVVVANFLQQHALVKKVYYPGLKDHPGYDLHRRQAEGPGVLISFELHAARASKLVVDHTQLFSTSVSFGSVKSLISQPSTMSHASIPKEFSQLPEGLIRLSVGIEDPGDLIEDLKKSLEKI